MSKTTFRKKFHSTKNLKISKPVEAGGRGGGDIKRLNHSFIFDLHKRQTEAILFIATLNLSYDGFFYKDYNRVFFLVQKFQFISIQTSFQKSQNGIFLSLLQVSFAIYHFLFTEKLSFLRSFEKS